jgi:hypothetical protein
MWSATNTAINAAITPMPVGRNDNVSWLLGQVCVWVYECVCVYAVILPRSICLVCPGCGRAVTGCAFTCQGFACGVVR